MSIKDIVYALIVNIALLAIIANLLSRIQTVQKLILQEKRGLKGDLILSMIFAGLIILSTCIGVKITSYSLEYKSHWCNVCRTSWRTVSGIIFFSHWSNICTYLLDTESICKRVCICYNFVRTFGSRILSLFSKRQVEIYGSVPVSMFCGNL